MSWSSAAQFPHIDDVNINLTDVAFASSRIFTLSTFGSAIQALDRLGIQRRHRVPVTSPPQPPDRVARGRFFPSKDRPHWYRNPRLFTESGRELIKPRSRAAEPVLRRSYESSALRAARTYAERARRPLNCKCPSWVSLRSTQATTLRPLLPQRERRALLLEVQ